MKFTEQSDIEDEEDKRSIKSNHSKTSTSSLKKDIMLFCFGLVTGGTLIKVSSKVFNK